jgi:selenide,water dikinase
MAVTGVVSPRLVIANTNARPGDSILLTKPLGTGIVTTGIKRGLASPAIQRKAIQSMITLNSVGAELAEKKLVTAGTDITGFGLLGHLANICRGSNVGATIDADAVPALAPEVLRLIEQDCIPGGSRKNLETANRITDWGQTSLAKRHLLTDAQTSGGLLLCVAPKDLPKVLRILHRAGTLCAAVIGGIFRSSAPRIRVISSHSGYQNGAKRVLPGRIAFAKNGKAFTPRRGAPHRAEKLRSHP